MIERTLFSSNDEAFRDSLPRFMDKGSRPSVTPWKNRATSCATAQVFVDKITALLMQHKLDTATPSIAKY